MGCCYVYKFEMQIPAQIPIVVNVYCADLVDCLIAQGYDPRCVRKNDKYPIPVGQAVVALSDTVTYTEYTTITTPEDCGNPPQPPGQYWTYTGRSYPCNYGGASTPILNPEGGDWKWRIEGPENIAGVVFVDKPGMLANILAHCLLDCAVPKPIDMDRLEQCFGDKLVEGEQATGGILVCRSCALNELKRGC